MGVYSKKKRQCLLKNKVSGVYKLDKGVALKLEEKYFDSPILNGSKGENSLEISL